jgi:hypothetical protein
VQLRALDAGNVRHGIGVLLQVILARGRVETVQVGDVDGVLGHERDIAIGVEHGRVHRAPETRIEHGAFRRFARHGIAQQGARVRFLRADGQFDRRAHFGQVGRLRVRGIGRECIENVLAHDIARHAAGGRQVGRIGADDDIAGIDQQVGIGRRLE